MSVDLKKELHGKFGERVAFGLVVLLLASLVLWLTHPFQGESTDKREVGSDYSSSVPIESHFYVDSTQDVYASVNPVQPTVEYPYGGYEGHLVSVTVGPDSSLFSALVSRVVTDANILKGQSDSPAPSFAGELASNLKRALENKVGHALDNVEYGDEFRLDLTLEPTRNGMRAPSLAECAAYSSGICEPIHKNDGGALVKEPYQANDHATPVAPKCVWYPNIYPACVPE